MLQQKKMYAKDHKIREKAEAKANKAAVKINQQQEKLAEKMEKKLAKAKAGSAKGAKDQKGEKSKTVVANPLMNAANMEEDDEADPANAIVSPKSGRQKNPLMALMAVGSFPEPGTGSLSLRKDPIVFAKAAEAVAAIPDMKK